MPNFKRSPTDTLKIWNSCKDLNEVSVRLQVKKKAASTIGCRLRQIGLDAKIMPNGGPFTRQESYLPEEETIWAEAYEIRKQRNPGLNIPPQNLRYEQEKNNEQT